MATRAGFLAFLLLVAPAVCVAPPFEPSARASVATLVSLDELCAQSSYVVIGTPSERKSVWEEIGNSRRIVTYTRIDVERTAMGVAPKSVWVRTLGGAVDKLGQSVSGEARLDAGKKALLFLASVNGIVVVTARAQGHFLVGADGLLGPSPDPGALVPQPGPRISAREVLVGASVDDAVVSIARAKAQLDGKK